jgi:hypothetical protein
VTSAAVGRRHPGCLIPAQRSSCDSRFASAQRMAATQPEARPRAAGELRRTTPLPAQRRAATQPHTMLRPPPLTHQAEVRQTHVTHSRSSRTATSRQMGLRSGRAATTERLTCQRSGQSATTGSRHQTSATTSRRVEHGTGAAALRLPRHSGRRSGSTATSTPRIPAQWTTATTERLTYQCSGTATATITLSAQRALLRQHVEAASATASCDPQRTTSAAEAATASRLSSRRSGLAATSSQG